jgi:CheY-like chemotaxis protein
MDTTTTAPAFPDLRGVTILVVEDDADTAELIVMALRKCNATVSVVSLVREARALLGELRPHVIVCDLALPGEDGIAFAAWVRREPRDRGGNTAMIAYTAYDTYFRQAVSAHGGFAAIVKKPSDPTYLCRVVADVIKGPAR